MDDTVRTMMRRCFAAIVVLAMFVAAPRLRASGTPLGMTIATPTPTPLPTATQFATPTPAPKSGTPIPEPTGQVVFFAGEVLDVQHGYIFFTTGDAFKLAPGVSTVDIDNGRPAPLPSTKMYAQAIFDANRQIVQLQVAHHPLPYNEARAVFAHQFAVALSPAVPNNDQAPLPPGASALNTSRMPLTGKVVAVKFVVEVPPDTPLNDPVYLSTDVSGWNPQAIRMERIDALHYAVTLPLRTGTQFQYKYTRGAWTTEERGRNGIAGPPRKFFLGSSPVGEPDTAVRDDIVYLWADYNPGGGGSQIVPGATPTPFNPNPFNFPVLPHH